LGRAAGFLPQLRTVRQTPVVALLCLAGRVGSGQERSIDSPFGFWLLAFGRGVEGPVLGGHASNQHHLPSFHFELNSSPRSLPRSPSFSISIRTSTRPTPTTLDQKPHAIPDTPHSLVRNPNLALGQRLSFSLSLQVRLLCRLPRPSILATTPADHSLNLQLDSIPAPSTAGLHPVALSQTILRT